MYIIDKAVKHDVHRQWALPDRVFFACGACQVLAFAFLERYPAAGYRAIWIKPGPGYTGNHIVVVRGDSAFDYHGYSQFEALMAHTRRKANRWWPGWHAELVTLPPEVLISEAKSRKYEGLWLREPKQFLHDALPRAHRFLDRFIPGTLDDPPLGLDKPEFERQTTAAGIGPAALWPRVS